MIKTSAFILVLTLLLVFESPGQISVMDFIPLKSTKTEVEKALGEGQQIQPNKLHYELLNETVTFILYNGGCDSALENEMKISDGIVLEIKVRPKNAQNAVSLLKSLDYQIFPSSLVSRYLTEDNSIHVDFQKGFIISARKTPDDPSSVEFIHYIPSKTKLPKCLINQMDPTSRYAFSEENFTYFKNCSIPHGLIATIYNGKKFETYNNMQLDRLAQHLKECPDHKGFLRYYRKKGTSAKRNLAYVNKFKDYLIKKGISSEQLEFEDFGISEDSRTDISIMPKDTLPTSALTI